MPDSFPFRTERTVPPEVISRVQARFEALDPLPGAVDADPEVEREPESPDTWVARTGGAPSEVLDQRIQRLDRQLQVLRGQLDTVFDEFEDRLAETESRSGVAEARASVAEARASVAETRAADAETRANDAHHRVDELIAELSRLVSGPTEVGSPRQDLRGALDRLRERLDVG
jgi:hypothetical protein